MKTAIVTGASTGIGYATAFRLVQKGWRVFAGIRKEADADGLRAAGEGMRPIFLDVTRPGDIAAACETVEIALAGRTLDGLVNNAGLAQMGPLPLQPMEEIRKHFEVNVFGAIAMAQAFMPHLGMDAARSGDPGRIVNVTSVGGRIASPFLGAYTATKHAMESVTDSLRRECRLFGVDAIAVGPGAVKTPIWDKAEDAVGAGPYSGTAWEESMSRVSEAMLAGGRDGRAPERVAEVIEQALTASNPRARYAPVPNKLVNFTIPTRLPKRFVDRVFARRFGLEAQ